MRVVIIGGGPAGAAAAITLAGRDGFEVTVIEAKVFPRVKVCGEFLSPAVTWLIEELVGRPALEQAGARRVDRLVLELGERAASWPLPEPAWTLSRGALDELLLDRARAAGASITQPERVAAVEYAANAATVQLASGERIEADLVIHADGSGRHDPAGPTPNRPGVVAMKCHLRQPPGQKIEGIRMRSARGVYVGTVQVEDGLSTCALVARKDRVSACGGRADDLVRSCWPAFDPAWRTTEWMASGVPASGYISPGHPRSFRIGNAAAAVEPIGGEGIGLALWSGMLLGRMLCTAGVEEAALPRVQEGFARAYCLRLRSRRPACRLAAAALMRPRLVKLLWPLLRAPDLLLAPWYTLTGKSLGRGEGDPALQSPGC